LRGLVDRYTEGLRCQDVNAGVRNFDATSPILIPVKKTRLTGMAADLAALVRDRSLIADMGALEVIAAAELDIPSTSFDAVLSLLEEVGLVELTRSGREVTGLTSEVPFYRDLYEILGRAWRDRRPSQLEEELVAVVDRLAAGPLLANLTRMDGSWRLLVGQMSALGGQSTILRTCCPILGRSLSRSSACSKGTGWQLRSGMRLEPGTTPAPSPTPACSFWSFSPSATARFRQPTDRSWHVFRLYHHLSPISMAEPGYACHAACGSWWTRGVDSCLN
jgi:hypothetical protein